MSDTNPNWETKVKIELANIASQLAEPGFTLEPEQLHISGERFLMTKEKLVLIGRRKSDHLRVVIKASNKQGGKKEIQTEKKARDTLANLSFASDTITLPTEIDFFEDNDYLFWLTEYIEQAKVFVEHSLQEQFFLILHAFESQEAFHATTFEHLNKVEKVFPVYYARNYFEEFAKFQKNFTEHYPNKKIERLLEVANEQLRSHKHELDTLCGYLTHTDFVPHNFRVKNNRVYMLDCSAVQFGNKYEGWARFLNYMIIHNPDLERTLLKYLKENRDRVEYLNLRLMRMFKIGFLLQYYALSLAKTNDDLKTLTKLRITFWSQTLQSIINDEPINRQFLEDYKKQRDSLRSEAEKARQREFAVA